MTDKIEIFCENTGVAYTVKKGITLIEMADLIGIKLNSRLIGTKVNYITRALNHICFHSCKVRFMDISDPSAMRIYVRSLCFILYVAIKRQIPEADLRIEHPISKGYFCALGLGRKIESEEIDAIRQEMKNIIAADLSIEFFEREAKEVIALFREQGCGDTADLIETSGRLYSHYYKMDEKAYFFDGILAPSTGYIDVFDVTRFHDGLLLRVPNPEKPSELEPMVTQTAMFKAFSQHIEFQQILGVSNVGQFNKAVQEKNISPLIMLAEAMQEKYIAQIANEIKQKYEEGVRIILVSGPSSSGKTTFTKRLQIQLITNLIRPLAISLDDYFVERDRTPIDENGEYDFESINALDLDCLNSDLTKLLQGEEVELPRFIFETGSREMSGEKIKLKEGYVLILEGIHALNPELTKMINKDVKYKIYVSALTTISLDDHNWVPTTDNRLLRRIIRDHNYRGHSVAATIARWRSVRNGEDKWIFPYQEEADATFNSAMLYELAAMRHKAERILMEVMPNQPEYGEAVRLLKFLSYFNYLSDSELPSTSLLREFLGGSSFVY